MEDLKLYNQDGTPYKGLFFYEKGKYFSGLEFNKERNRLLTQEEANVVIVKNRIPVKGFGYTPNRYVPVLNDIHYNTLGFTRYFVQKLTKPYGTITEVSPEDYSIGLFEYGNSAITGLYQGSSVYWSILGNKEDVESKNKLAVMNVTDRYPKFVGLDLHITDYLEYFKEV